MTGFRDIPFDAARQVADGVRAASAARRSCVRIAIEVDEGAPAYLVSCVRDAFVPQTSTGLLHIAAFDAGGTVRVSPTMYSHTRTSVEPFLSARKHTRID